MKEIDKKKIDLKRSDMANMFRAYEDDAGNTVFYCGRTIEFGDISKLNEKYVTKHVWRDEDTWHKLAYRFYSNPKLWWIIAKANDITNPFAEPDVGTLVNIPTNAIVDIVLDRIQS